MAVGRARPAPWRRRSLLRAGGACCAFGPLAWLGTAEAAASQDGQLEAELVRTGLYLIRGGTGNSLLRLSANGMVLVDGTLPGSHRALMSQVRRISRLSDMPIRVLVLTDPLEAHAGDCAQFMAAGVTVVAQRDTVARLSLPGPDDAAVRARVIAYDDQRTIRLGGVEVLLNHFGPARTSGDSVVHFPDLKVVALGDLFPAAAPEPDFSAGGSLVGWSAVLARVLELDFDRVVPASGPVASRADLVVFKERVDAVATRAGALVRAGVGKDALMGRLRSDDLGWQLAYSGPVLDGLFAELSR